MASDITADEGSLSRKGALKKTISQTSWTPGKQDRFSRIVIYPKDIQCITGKSERYGRMMIRRVKAHFGKDDHQLVTLREFCEYTGLRMEEVRGVVSK